MIRATMNAALDRAADRVVGALIGSPVRVASRARPRRAGARARHALLTPRPLRLRLVDAPIVVFGHTHDPRWQPLRGGGVYVNSGTWLPATRPGLRRSFTFVLIQPAASGPPSVELRQWREGVSQAFDAGANIGAGVSMNIPPISDVGGDSGRSMPS